MNHPRLPLLVLALGAIAVGNLVAATSTPKAKVTQMQSALDAAKAAAETTAAIDQLQADMDAAAAAGPLTPAQIKAFQARLDATKGGAAGSTGNTTEPASDALSFFKTSGLNYSNRAVVATTDIIAATAHCWDKTTAPFHTIGILLTGSVPVNNPPAKDYLTSQLLQRNGAVGNLFFSFHIPKEEVVRKKTKGVVEDVAPSSAYHKQRVDKSYFYSQDSDQLLLYMTNGWGGRMYRFNTTPGTPTNYYGVATGYLGLGVDGIAKDTLGGANGSIDFEIYASANYTSGHTLNLLYGGTSAPSYYTTGNATLKLNISDFTIALSYGSALAQSMRAVARDVATISVSYTGK